MSLHRDVLDVRGFQTEVLSTHAFRTRTPTTTTNHLFEEAHEQVIVIIPGNPGVVEFYETFVLHLSEKLSSSACAQIPILVVGHVGHSRTDLNEGRLFTLREQIEHKERFLLDHFPNNTTFYLLGHSVGSYISLNVFIREIESENRKRIRQLVHLFPTIQYLYPGLPIFVKTTMYAPLRNAVGLFFYYLPNHVKHLLTTLLLPHFSSDHQSLVKDLLNSYTFTQNVLYMARTEAAEIEALNEDLVRQNEKKSTFLFGQTDPYTPLDLHYHQLRERFPEAQYHLAQDEVPHAFVLQHSETSLNKFQPFWRSICALWGNKKEKT